MRHPLLTGLALGLALSSNLAGCASAEELQREDEASCAGYGFQPATADFDGCVQRERLARQQYEQKREQQLNLVPVFGTGAF